MNIIFTAFLFLGITASAQTGKNDFHFKSKVIFDQEMSCRAIYIDKDNVWIGMDKGRFGYYDKKNDTLIVKQIESVSQETEFRSIAGTKDAVFILAVGNPATLIRINKKTLQETIVYKEVNDKVFYDSMHFADDLNGFAMGDPINDCLSFIKTIDGGFTWQKVDCNVFPKIGSGEAAFAASNSNLIIKEKSIFLVSGGKLARIFTSEDFGFSWNVYATPIEQGKGMTGIFSGDFYDSKNGIIAGGDYEKQEQNWKNKAITSDGGKSWKLVGEYQGIGYISCIKYVPNSKGRWLVAVGGNGLFYSKNKGKSWTKFSNEKHFFAIQFESKNVFYLSGKNKLVRYEIF